MSEAEMFVLNPTGKRKASGLQLAARPADLRGKTVGLVDIGEWWMVGAFMQHYGELLKERCGVGEVVYVNLKKEGRNLKSKAGITPEETIEQLATKWDAVFIALGN